MLESIVCTSAHLQCQLQCLAQQQNNVMFYSNWLLVQELLELNEAVADYLKATAAFEVRMWLRLCSVSRTPLDNSQVSMFARQINAESMPLRGWLFTFTITLMLGRHMPADRQAGGAEAPVHGAGRGRGAAAGAADRGLAPGHALGSRAGPRHEGAL